MILLTVTNDIKSTVFDLNLHVIKIFIRTCTFFFYSCKNKQLINAIFGFEVDTFKLQKKNFRSLLNLCMHKHILAV